MLASQPFALASSPTVHLRLVQALGPRAATLPDAASRILGAAELPWLGERLEPAPWPGTRRFHADLGLAAGSGSRIVLRKAAYVDLGQVEVVRDGVRVPVSWRAASLAPLFPVFAGQLTISDDALVLEGEYAPPGGELGVVADRALLNIAARRTAVWVLRLIADRLEEAGTSLG